MEEQVKYRQDARDDAPLTQRTGDGGGWRNDPAMPSHLREALLELAERQTEHGRKLVENGQAINACREDVAEVRGLALAIGARVGRLDRERELDHEDVRRLNRDVAQVRAVSVDRPPSLHDLDAHIEDTARREARAVVRKARSRGWSARQIAALITAITVGVAAIIGAAAKVFGGGK